jgi:hypothetical protein
VRQVYIHNRIIAPCSLSRFFARPNPSLASAQSSPRLLNNLVAAPLRPSYWSITPNFSLSNSKKNAMPRGSKPGERRGGRQKGRLNKLSIGRMKAQLAVSPPEFDPYDQLEIITKTFLEQADAEKRRDKPNMRLIGDLLDKAARVLRDMVPYTRPRLVATKISGDKEAPLFDLSGLSNSELAFLRRTVLKATVVADRRED